MFPIRERGSTVRTEVVGGVTTFVSMAYIIVVNPAILAFAGIPQGPSTVATIVIAAFGTLLISSHNTIAMSAKLSPASRSPLSVSE